MIIRLVLQLPERVIRDIEVEMPVAPHGACHEAKQCLAPLIGMRIAPGFTARVRKSVGRKAGCNHLQALLAAMAPAAFQGAWSFRVSRPIDPESYRGMAQNLRDSCWAWREGGPLVKKLIDIE